MKKEKVTIPKNCPCCNSTLERVKDQIFCRNSACDAKNAKRLYNFTQKAKIKGFGEKTLEKLGIATVVDLYQLDLAFMIETLGEKMGNKLMLEIEKSKNMALATFLSALSIPLVGKTASDKLVKVINSIEELNSETCKKAGLGEKVTASLLRWKLDEYPNYLELPLVLSVEEVIVNDVPTLNIIACSTGKIEGYTRSTLTEMLNSLGVKVVSSVTAKTDYLICEELKGSSKEVKANSLGVEIISLNNFLNRIK